MSKNCLAIEHLARFEQRRELKKGKFVDLFNTRCVQNLSHQEKEEFFNYLKRKKRTPKLIACLFVLCLIGAFIFSSKMTGLSVLENQPSSLSVSLIFILIAVVLVIGIIFARKRRLEFELSLE